MTSINHTISVIDAYIAEMRELDDSAGMLSEIDDVLQDVFIIKHALHEKNLNDYTTYATFVENLQNSNIVARINTLNAKITHGARRPLSINIGATNTHADATRACGTCTASHEKFVIYNGCTFCGNCGIDLNIAVEEELRIDASSDMEIKTRVQYHPLDHCCQWLDCIQGNENVNIPADIIQEIKRRHDRSGYAHITCAMIRSYLKAMELAKYNSNIVKIKSCITGVAAPQLSEEELARVKAVFTSAIACYTQIRHDVRKSAPYHPYFLYKIIHMLYFVDAKKSQRVRIGGILNNIHMQSSGTTKQNDDIWRQICRKLNFSFYASSSIDT